MSMPGCVTGHACEPLHGTGGTLGKVQPGWFCRCHGSQLRTLCSFRSSSDSTSHVIPGW